MSPPSRPNSRSRSSGDSICRPITLAAKPGAYLSTVAVLVPGFAVRQLRRDVLAEQAGDMLARWGERVVQGRGDQHLDHRLAAPAVGFGVLPGAVHIVQTRREDDAGGEMIAGARQCGERGQRV